MEATWILLNLSYYDSDNIMINNDYSFVYSFNDILEGNDYQMIDLVI